jgi:phosphoglycolate phosphatase
MNKQTLVLFDIAGTLVADTGLTLEAYRSVLAEAALPSDPAWLRSRYGCKKNEVFSELLARSGRDESGADALSREYASTLEALILESPPSIFPEVDRVFEELQSAGCLIGLVTGFNASTAEQLRAAGNWSMDVIVGSDEVEKGRPSPDLVIEAMHRAGQPDPSHVACVGDTPRDLEMGDVAGCGWNIGVATGSYTEEELRQCPHTHVLQDLQDLPCLFIQRTS